jgi:hypothetical protein
MLRQLNLCPGQPQGYRDQMGGMFRWVLGLSLICAALVAPSAASADVQGSVAGWHDPVSGWYDHTESTLELSVQATPDSVPLQNAAASLGGELVALRDFVDGSCTQTCPAGVELSVDTCNRPSKEEPCRRPDGERRLLVWVTDENGATTELLDRTITIENAPRVTPCKHNEFECRVSIQIGSGALSPQPSPGGGSVGGESGPVCASPRLSMALASKPLRRRRGVPVLAAGRAYRYAGTLTCRINGRRRPALRGTEVQVRNRLRGWTISKPSITLRRPGDVVARLAYRSSRTVIFRVRGAGGEVVRVRIPIRVVRVKKERR